MSAERFEIHIVGELAKIKAEPGDVFVVHVDTRLTTDQANKMQAYVQARVPGFPVLVLDRSSRLVVANAGDKGGA